MGTGSVSHHTAHQAVTAATTAAGNARSQALRPIAPTANAASGPRSRKNGVSREGGVLAACSLNARSMGKPVAEGSRFASTGRSKLNASPSARVRNSLSDLRSAQVRWPLPPNNAGAVRGNRVVGEPVTATRLPKNGRRPRRSPKRPDRRRKWGCLQRRRSAARRQAERRLPMHESSARFRRPARRCSLDHCWP